MTAWELPTSLNVNGCDYEIRTDYRVILDILMAMNDPDIFSPAMSEKQKNAERVMTMLQILYIDFESIPKSDWKEAAEKAKEFIDCGLSEDGRYHPKIMDWKQDAAIIVPAINKVAGTDIRADKYVHWWTFMGYYLEIGDCLFSSVVNIRKKKSTGKKLEKWEREFYQNNQSIIDLKANRIERSEEEKKALRELFGMR